MDDQPTVRAGYTTCRSQCLARDSILDSAAQRHISTSKTASKSNNLNLKRYVLLSASLDAQQVFGARCGTTCPMTHGHSQASFPLTLRIHGISVYSVRKFTPRAMSEGSKLSIVPISTLIRVSSLPNTLLLAFRLPVEMMCMGRRLHPLLLLAFQIQCRIFARRLRQTSSANFYHVCRVKIPALRKAPSSALVLPYCFMGFLSQTVLVILSPVARMVYAALRCCSSTSVILPRRLW